MASGPVACCSLDPPAVSGERSGRPQVSAIDLRRLSYLKPEPPFGQRGSMKNRMMAAEVSPSATIAAVHFGMA